MKYLDFDNYEKGYEEMKPSIENFKKNISKQICYVTKSDVDNRRGYVFTRYGIIHKVRYNSIYLDEYDKCIDKRDVLEVGIKIEES